MLDPALGSELRVGQPVSVGLVSLSVGSGVPILSEVSIVTKGAVDGACITRRHELKPVPSQRTEQPKPRAIAAPVPANTVVYRTRKPQVDHHAELQRRIDFAEANGHHVDVEMIIVNMQAELGLGGIDRAWARPSPPPTRRRPGARGPVTNQTTRQPAIPVFMRFFRLLFPTSTPALRFLSPIWPDRG
jgi:hypothetical protein